MAAAASCKNGKHAAVSTSSSSEEDDDADESGSELESETDAEDSEDEYTDDGGEHDDDDDGCGDDSEGKPSDEERCKKVIQFLQRQKSVDMLKLEDCKAYLRKHELRISGTKAICIGRILEHWRIKDGNGEKLYPQSSFNINCTGDVCKDDVILFKQRVYEKFDIVKRGGNIIGKRTIAGRVVKESYGAAKQQHTFTVEILWSKGVKPLPPLYPLLVKGRNLYRLKTFRQVTSLRLASKRDSDVSSSSHVIQNSPWKDEAERSRVLAEKHKRGAAARHIRAIAKARSANNGLKRERSFSNKRPPSRKKRKKDSEPASREMKQQDSAKMLLSKNTKNKKVPSNSHARLKQGAKRRHQGSSARNSKETNNLNIGVHTHQPVHHPFDDHRNVEMGSHHFHNIAVAQPRIRMPHFPACNVGNPSIGNRMPHYQPLKRGNYVSHPYSTYTSQFVPQSSSYPYASYAPQFDPSSSSHLPSQVNSSGHPYTSQFAPGSSSHPYVSYASQFDSRNSSHLPSRGNYSGHTFSSGVQFHRWRQP